MDLSAFVGVWCGLHLQIAQLSGNPEIAITETDGKAFLTAAQNVLRHYPLVASQKAVDWAAFMFTASFIYVPRAVAIAQRKAGSVAGTATEGEARPSATVFHFHGPPNGSGQSDGFASPPPIPPTVDAVVDEPELEMEPA